MTGNNGYRMLLVPAPAAKRKETTGATKVIRLGLAAMSLAATETIQSIPPATCMVELATITANTMRRASTGGDPGGSPMTKTKTATPVPPQSPRPTPLERVPITMAAMTIKNSMTKRTVSNVAPESSHSI